MNRNIFLTILFQIIVFLVLLDGYSFAQDPTYRLTVESGGYMDFKIYSLDRYDGGITYTDWTTLRIDFNDSDNSHEWYLAFKANTNEFTGSGTRFLPLSSVSIFVESMTPTSGTYYPGPHPLNEDRKSVV